MSNVHIYNNGIVVRARNLLKQTNLGTTGFAIWNNHTAKIAETVLDDGTRALRIYTEDGSPVQSVSLKHDRGYPINWDKRLTPGMRYTSGFAINSNGALTGLNTVISSYNNSFRFTDLHEFGDFPGDDAWHRMSAVLTVVTDFTGIDVGYWTINFNTNAASEVLIKDISLYEGAVDIGWTRAPEDIDDRLAAIEAKLGIAADEIWPDGPEIIRLVGEK